MVTYWIENLKLCLVMKCVRKLGYFGHRKLILHEGQLGAILGEDFMSFVPFLPISQE